MPEPLPQPPANATKPGPKVFGRRWVWACGLALLPLLPLAAFQAPGSRPGPPVPPQGAWQEADVVTRVVEVRDDQGTRRLEGTGRVRVFLPPAYDGKTPLPLLIALHGWNHSPSHWKDESRLAELAARYGVVVACPEMGTSVFETAFFKETSRAWGKVPGTPWLLQAVVLYVQEHYAVRKDPAGVAVMGYSTGGRGAVMAVVHSSGVFGFCASLSGTYDLTALKPGTGEYKIHAHVYGERAGQPERWQAESSVAPAQAAAFQGVGLYIAHGGKDPVVEVSQAELMAAFMRRHRVAGDVVIDPEGRHDWAFWNRHLPEVFERFRTVFTRTR